MDHAAPPVATPSPPPAARLEVSADRIDGALDLSDVTLEGHVRLRVGRAVLTAPRLRLRLSPTGDAAVEGPVVVSPCGCADPPLALGVDRAVLDAEGGATLRGVRLLAFGHTVLATPWLALRSETQFGLLGPTLEWRGADGPLVGTGLHVPLWPRAALDVRPAAYLRGGW